MFISGGAGHLPLPQTPTEWLALSIALVLVGLLVKRWLDQD